MSHDAVSSSAADAPGGDGQPRGSLIDLCDAGWTGSTSLEPHPARVTAHLTTYPGAILR